MIKFIKKIGPYFVAGISIIGVLVATVLMALMGKKYNGIDQNYIDDEKEKIDNMEKKKDKIKSVIKKIKKDKEARNEKIDNLKYDDIDLSNDPIVKRNRNNK